MATPYEITMSRLSYQTRERLANAEGVTDLYEDEVRFEGSHTSESDSSLIFLVIHPEPQSLQVGRQLHRQEGL